MGKVATSPLPFGGSPTLSAGTIISNGYVAHMRAKWLQHPCRLGGPQWSAQGQKSEMPMWSPCGQSGYITPTVLGVPNAQRRDRNYKWQSGPHVCKVALAPLQSWRSPTLSTGTANQKWLCGPRVVKVATVPLSSWGSTTLSRGTKIRNGYVAHRGQSGYITPAILGVPNAQRGDENQKWLSGPHVDKVATSPLPSWGSTTFTAGTKIRNG